MTNPTFRAIEGFPIGEDDAILALSDPPHYTACPNSFLPEIVARWQEERAAIRAGLGLPNHEASDYSSEPVAADVSDRGTRFRELTGNAWASAVGSS